MILNEDYFDDLEIKDEDIMADDTPLDVEEPKHELTVEEYHKLPEQYSHLIRFEIQVDDDTTFIQTSILPSLFKRLDTIFEYYSIVDYKYVLASSCYVEDCNAVVKFGNYQLFCEEGQEDNYINGKYKFFFIHVFVNYPQFTYKRTFRFLYTMLNLYCKQNNKMMIFKPLTDDYVIELYFVAENNHIRFYYYKKTYGHGDVINLSKELTEEDKREFYYAVFYHFFEGRLMVPYKLIDKDVPFKPIILK